MKPTWNSSHASLLLYLECSNSSYDFQNWNLHSHITQSKKLQDLCSIIYVLCSTDQHGIEIYEIMTSHIGKQRIICININGRILESQLGVDLVEELLQAVLSFPCHNMYLKSP